MQSRVADEADIPCLFSACDASLLCQVRVAWSEFNEAFKAAWEGKLTLVDEADACLERIAVIDRELGQGRRTVLLGELVSHMSCLQC